MIERVARAIQRETCPNDPYDELVDEGKLSHQKVARAAIAAMRDMPDETFKKAFMPREDGDLRGMRIVEPDRYWRKAWQALIDAALEEK